MKCSIMACTVFCDKYKSLGTEVHNYLNISTCDPLKMYNQNLHLPHLPIYCELIGFYFQLIIFSDQPGWMLRLI